MQQINTCVQRDAWSGLSYTTAYKNAHWKHRWGHQDGVTSSFVFMLERRASNLSKSQGTHSRSLASGWELDLQTQQHITSNSQVSPLVYGKVLRHLPASPPQLWRTPCSGPTAPFWPSQGPLLIKAQPEIFGFGATHHKKSVMTLLVWLPLVSTTLSPLLFTSYQYWTRSRPHWRDTQYFQRLVV